MKKHRCDITPQERYIGKKLQLLRDFCVPITQEILDHLSALYPNEIAIESYVQSLISRKF